MKRIPSLYCLLFSSVLLMITHGFVFAADIRSGLISYWPMDTDSGGTTPDIGPMGNNMTEFNAPTYASGQISNAVSFNGTSQYLNNTHTFDNSATGLPIYASPKGYTIALWVKGAAQTAKYIFTEASTASTSPLLLIQTGNAAASNSKLDILIRTTGGATLINHVASATIVFDNTWHHIAWVDNLGAVKLYVDGNPDTANYNYAYPGSSSLAMNTTTIGQLIRAAGPGAANYFSGQFDDVAIWERPLSQDEVNQVRTNSLNIPASPLILTQPAGSTNALGSRVALSVSAVGAPPLAFQWFKNGAPVDGATARSLVLTNLTTAGSNYFSVTVSNTANVATSDPIPVVILPDATPDLPTGLISYWPMDTVIEGPTSTNTPDIFYLHTDFALFTNLTAATTLVQGQFSNAVTFALNQYGKRVGGTPIYNSTNYTISLWINGNSGQLNKQVFAEGGTNGTGANGDFFFLGTENPVGGGLLDIKSSASPILNDLKSKQVVFDGTWHHVVWVDENGKARLYVDGVVDATDFTYYRSNLVLNATAVGALYRATPGNFFFGSVDEVALWNRALSWTEIQRVRTNGVPLPEPRIPPAITQQPLGSTNRLGDRITLTVTATGSLPLSYQWLKDGSPLTDQTNSTLTLLLTTVATNDFSVTITNIANPTNSALAHVVVLPDPTPDLDAGLFSYWPLDTVTAPPNPTSPDVASHDDFALTGLDSSALMAGRFVNALSFGGSQYAQQMGGFPIYLANNYTVSFWVNAPVQPDARTFAEGSTTSANPLFSIGTDVSGVSGSADILIRTDGGVASVNHRQSTRTVFDSTWHHLVWVDENGQAKLFVDGVLDETDFTYSRGVLSLNTTALGALVSTGGAANFFAGAIDDVAVWDRRLSWTEIQQLQSAAVPAPVAPTAPTIVGQPADQTNFFFAATSFTVLAGGTSPLSFQWRKDGTDIPVASNPSATNSVLTLVGILGPEATGGYSVVVTNAAGKATSREAQLVLTSGSFNIDVDSAAAPNIQSGFVELTTSSPRVTLGGIGVTLSAIGGIPLADRNRTTAPMVLNNPPLMTQAQIYNDFIFGNNNATLGAGIDILIDHLAPNTNYAVTIWSFDPLSGGARISDWTENASGTPVPIVTGYTFNGTVLPVNDYEYTLGGLLTSSPDGRLDIQGVKTGTDFTVFVNALRIEAVPTPSSRILGASIVNGNLRLLAVGRYPGQAITFEQNTNLIGGTWVPAVGANPLSANGMVITVEFPVTETQLFYRAVSPIIP